MKGRVYLYPVETAPNGGSHLTAGSFRDLDRLGITLQDGMILQFYSDDADDTGNPAHLCCEGAVFYDASHGIWYANVDMATFQWVPATDTNSW